jgi:hypothetical protein
VLSAVSTHERRKKRDFVMRVLVSLIVLCAPNKNMSAQLEVSFLVSVFDILDHLVDFYEAR